jgi:hypothetical protein
MLDTIISRALQGSTGESLDSFSLYTAGVPVTGVTGALPTGRRRPPAQFAETQPLPGRDWGCAVRAACL